MSPDVLESIRKLHACSDFGLLCITCGDQWPCSTAELVYFPEEVEQIADGITEMVQRAQDRLTELRMDEARSRHPSRATASSMHGLPDNVIPLLRKRTV